MRYNGNGDPAISSYTNSKGEIRWKITSGWSEFHQSDVMPEYDGPVTRYLDNYETEKQADKEYDKRFPPIHPRKKGK